MYLKLPTPIAVIKNDDRNSWDFKALMDLGKYFMMVDIDFDKYSDKQIKNSSCSLDINLNYIDKDYLPKDKLLDLLGFTQMKYKKASIENWYLLHFQNSIMAYSAQNSDHHDSKKSSYHVDEVLWSNTLGLITYK